MSSLLSFMSCTFLGMTASWEAFLECFILSHFIGSSAVLHNFENSPLHLELSQRHKKHVLLDHQALVWHSLVLITRRFGGICRPGSHRLSQQSVHKYTDWSFVFSMQFSISFKLVLRYVDMLVEFGWQACYIRSRCRPGSKSHRAMRQGHRYSIDLHRQYM